MLGQRDELWRQQFGVASLKDSRVWMRSLDDVGADPAGAGVAAVRLVRKQAAAGGCASTLMSVIRVEFAAQGLPDVTDDPGGSSWTQLPICWWQPS